jgi:hypothetical protein
MGMLVEAAATLDMEMVILLLLIPTTSSDRNTRRWSHV